MGNAPIHQHPGPGAPPPTGWPDFLVIGAPKSGTTSLYHYLRQHPDIFLSPTRKEGRFFSDIWKGAVHWPAFYHFDAPGSAADYQALFAKRGNESRAGDVSPDYLAYADIAAPQALSLCGPATRIIAILRNPVDRAWSHYLQNVRRDAEFLSFAKTLEIEAGRKAANWGFQWLYTETGRYAGKLQPWMQRFDHRLVLLQDELDRDAPGTMRRIFEFLDLDPDAPVSLQERYNTGGIPAAKLPVLAGDYDHRTSESFEALHAELVAPVTGISSASTADGVYPPPGAAPVQVPPMNADIRAMLEARFAPEIDALERLLGRSLDAWRPA
ncbi:sulfotransferase family protein [Maricaulis salignorans]|uniref:sulfotransferase family protein n=1 Tax=Maricaulis salignorans TaxID=144026 RepID=UPI003A905450